MARAIFPILGPFALAMPALIECEYMKVRAECGSNKVPPMRVRGTAVNEQHRALPFTAIVEAIEGESVGFETMPLHSSIAIFKIIVGPLTHTLDTLATRAFRATILLVV